MNIGGDSTDYQKIAQHCEADGIDLVDYLREHPEVGDVPNDTLISAAECVIRTCGRLGVPLSIDGDRVVLRGYRGGGKEPGIPLSLTASFEEHARDIFRILKADRRKYRYRSRQVATFQESTNIALVLKDPDFGFCEVCGDPASMVAQSWRSIAGLMRFCSGKCLAEAKQQETELSAAIAGR